MTIHDLATQGKCEGVLLEIRTGTPVDSRDERDYTPLACAACSPQADEEMLRLLTDAGADVNAVVDEGKHFPLELAACSGNLSKAQFLLDAGANVNLAPLKGYTALINVMYALHADDKLVLVVDLLVKNGAQMSCTTDYGEFPLGVASFQGRFDAVRYLLEAGADTSPLNWSALMQAIAVGSCDDMAQLLTDPADLVSRDRFDRTPLLLAASVGDAQKIELIYSNGANVNERGRTGDTALIIAAGRGKSEVVHWLLNHGAEINATDNSGKTALMSAAEAGSTDCVQLLLKGGANAHQTDIHKQNAIEMASNEPIVRLLIEAGEDIGDINAEVKRTLLGLREGHVWTTNKSEFASDCRPRFGNSNPEVMPIPFWRDMVKAGVSACSAKMQFGETNIQAGPVWCFSRFGTSFTELPDDRFVQIGGEHEDFYDPDFCIYNDVVVHDRSGNFTIMGYPKHVFPPTDFHSATYVDGFIYIVGGLGYQGERKFGTTPVYRLDCQTWRMETVPSFGDNPGWLFNHRAVLSGTGTLVIADGTICKEIDEVEQEVENAERFLFDLPSMMWTKLEAS